VNDARETFVDLPTGRFRALDWPGSEPAVLFLHGLTGVAEVWGPTIAALGPDRPRCIAIDQRGHGQSEKQAASYEISMFVGDVLAVIDALGLDRPQLVGHSMGARVAMVLAARHPEAIRSVAIVDIGPDQWKANWQESVAAFDRMPATWPDAETAIGGAGRARPASSVDAAVATGRPDPETMRQIALARLKTLPDGSVTWLADREALKKTVIAHRSRGYWDEWRRLVPPALCVHGGNSTEVRPQVAARMRELNRSVAWDEFDGVAHNIPLIAPARLATSLSRFWRSISTGAGSVSEGPQTT
jgi:2-(acetamidomethylene)succinate hydrolase